MANDAGSCHSDCFHCSHGIANKSANLRCHHLHQFPPGNRRQGIHVVRVVGIAQQVAGDALIFNSASHNVVGNCNANRDGHSILLWKVYSAWYR